MAGPGLELILPDWPAPPAVRALATTRRGGVSGGPFASLNLGDRVGDDPLAVAENRRLLRAAAALPAEPAWLEQVHGATLVELPAGRAPPRADAAASSRAGVVAAVLTADCLPLLFCDRGGRRIAAAHGGWRGLAAGIIERVVADFGAAGIAPGELLAWLGPAIGPAAYEVDERVRDAFPAAGDAPAFRLNARGRWQLDLCALARGRLAAAGVTAVHGGGRCTASEPRRFYSYRRDGACGRQACLVWLEPRPAPVAGG